MQWIMESLNIGHIEASHFVTCTTSQVSFVVGSFIRKVRSTVRQFRID